MKGDTHLSTQKKASGFYEEEVWQKEIFSEWYAAERLGPDGWKQTRFTDDPRKIYGTDASEAFDDILKQARGEKVEPKRWDEEKVKDPVLTNVAVHTLDKDGNIIGLSYGEGQDIKEEGGD